MPNFIENFGLDFFLDDEETMTEFMGYLTQEGKAISGYFGCPSIFNGMGSIDLFVKTRKNEDGKLEAVGLDTHCSGHDIWTMRSTGMDITPKNSLATDKLLMLKKHDDGTGMVPIHLINADVLPSFLEDDVIIIQMCALPLDINYYADEDDYARNQPKDDSGRQWLVADGSLFPISFLKNHAPENYSENEDFATDDQVLFTATVKALYHGVFAMGENKEKTYIQCVVDTQYGELSFAHTIDQVKPEQRDNLRVGAVISGVCILSGDVAIYEYEDGIIKDFEHNYKLLRQVIVNGQAERMRPVLKEDSSYISDSSGEVYSGPDRIIERLDYVHSKQNNKCFALPAKITQIDDEDMEYAVGTRCIVISYETEDNYGAIAFIDVDDAGLITKLLITTDGRYHFKIDEPIHDSTPLDDIELPKSVVEPIFNRAQFYEMIDEKNVDAFVDGIKDYSSWESDAERMLKALKNDPQPDAEIAFKNIFGYLFAKAIEKAVNSRQNGNGNLSLNVSYRPEEAFAGEISSIFDDKEKHQKIVDAMEKGKQFYKDFHFYIQTIEPSEEEYMEEIIRALVFIQHIGSLYALKYFGLDCTK